MVKNEMRERIKKIKIREKNPNINFWCRLRCYSNKRTQKPQSTCAHTQTHSSRLDTHTNIDFFFFVFGIWMLFWCVSSSSHRRNSIAPLLSIFEPNRTAECTEPILIGVVRSLSRWCAWVGARTTSLHSILINRTIPNETKSSTIRN